MLASRFLKPSALFALLASGAASCQLDERTLTGPTYAAWLIGGASDGGEAQGGDANASAGQPLADAGESSTAFGGAANGGSAGTNPTAGSGGNAEPPIVDGCPDLDFNGKGDCKETLVTNPNFAADVGGWTAGDDVSLEWSAQNYLGDAPSGSAQITVRGYSDGDGMLQRASSQCVKLGASSQLQLFAHVFFEGDQGAGGPSIGLFFFGNEDCSGPALGVPFQASAARTDAWETLAAQPMVPEGSRSALVRLAVSKPYRTLALTASFDNILLRGMP